jgi:hypothetical protein
MMPNPSAQLPHVIWRFVRKGRGKKSFDGGWRPFAAVGIKDGGWLSRPNYVTWLGCFTSRRGGGRRRPGENGCRRCGRYLKASTQ